MGLSQYIQSVRDRRDAEQQKAWNSVMPALEMRYNMMQKELVEKEELDVATRDWDNYWSQKYKDRPEAMGTLSGITDIHERNRMAKQMWSEIPSVTETDEAGVSTTRIATELEIAGGDFTRKTIPAPSEDKETSQKDIGAKYNLDSTIAGITGAVEKQEAIDKRRELEGLGFTPENQWAAFSNWYQAKYPAQEEPKEFKIPQTYQDEFVQLEDVGYGSDHLKMLVEKDPAGIGKIKIISDSEKEIKESEFFLNQILESDEKLRLDNGKLVLATAGSRDASIALLERNIKTARKNLQKYSYLKSPERIDKDIAILNKERVLYTTEEKTPFLGTKKPYYYYKGNKIKKEEYDQKVSEIDKQIEDLEKAKTKGNGTGDIY